MNISGDVVKTAKVGDKISLPKATATDNYSETSVVVYVVTPVGEVVEIDMSSVDGFVATKAGVYTVVYSVNDVAGNFVINYYKITVAEGK